MTVNYLVSVANGAFATDTSWLPLVTLAADGDGKVFKGDISTDLAGILVGTLIATTKSAQMSDAGSAGTVAGILLYGKRLTSVGTVTISGDTALGNKFSITVNASDLPATEQLIYFRFAAPVDLSGGLFPSTLQLTITSSSDNNAAFDGTITAGASGSENWFHGFTQAATPTAPTVDDYTYVVGAVTGAGATTAFTITGTATSAVNTVGYLGTLTPTYALTVDLGTGDGTYAAGDLVTITADAPAAGYVFDKWTSLVGGSFAMSIATPTVFTMPDNATTVTAKYRLAPASRGGNQIGVAPATSGIVGGTGLGVVGSSAGL